MVLAVDGVAADQDADSVLGECKSMRQKKRRGYSREASEKILESGGSLPGRICCVVR